MFEVEKRFSFEAGHVLKSHTGKCCRPHGHSYVLKVAVRRKALLNEGMVMDFGDISAVVKPMLNEFFDHKWLNDTLKMDDPTSERICAWIYGYLESKISGLYRITIFETENSCASYWKE